MQTYLDLLDHVLTTASEVRPHRHRHPQHVRLPDAVRPARGLPAADHQEGAHPLGRSRSCCGSCGARPTSKWLHEQGVTIWDEWADADGELGPDLRLPVAVLADPGRAAHRPDRRGDRARSGPTRTRAGTWSAPGTSPSSTQMALPPCHTMFQFYVPPDGRRLLLPALPALGRRLPRRAVQHRLVRAADPPVAQVCGLGVGDFVHTLGDAHLYPNHLDQARLQLTREPRPLPSLVLNPDVHRHRRLQPRRHQRSRATTRTRASRRRSRSEPG